MLDSAPVGMRSKQTLLLILLLPLVGLLVSCTEPAKKPVRVVMLGFDGAGWSTIDPLLEEGKLPFLAKLKREAAWAPLETFKPTKSPVIWTSVVTGKSMVKHGILDFVFVEENDIQIPYSNSEKREPSIWQILERFGHRSVVVNWFVTDPPDQINGVMVSNRFRKTLLLQGERVEAMRSSVHPPDRFDALRKHLSLDYQDIRLAKGLPDLAERYREIHPSKSADDIVVLRDFWIHVLQEALIESVSLELYQTEDFDFYATYFRLPDIVQHFILHLLDPDEVERTLAALKDGSLTDEQRVAFEKELAMVLEPFYGYMETIIEEFMTAPGQEDTTFIVLSDHGFTLHGGGYDHYHIPRSMEAPAGIFLMKGPDVKPGRAPAISVYDITPTILYLYGYPIGEKMDGRPITEILNVSHDIATERYSRELMRSTQVERDEELDKQTLEELKSLGYIK